MSETSPSTGDAESDAGVRARLPQIRDVYRDRPWEWLKTGWADLGAAPTLSLAYGAVYALTGAVLCYVAWRFMVFHLTFPIMAGFLLLGPLAACGLYEISRRHAAGEAVDAASSVFAFRRNTLDIALMGVILLLINFAWVRFATLIFFLFFADNPPPVDTFGFIGHILSLENVPFLIIGNALGAAFAIATFAVSVVSIPMLLDRPHSTVIEAVVTSVMACRKNPKTMLLWAWLVVLFIGAGMLAGFIGLIVTLPLIGHASWAAYKDVVDWGDEGASPSI